MILYLIAAVADGGLAFDLANAGAIYALLISLVYLLRLPGGWIADRLTGQRRAVLIGGVRIAAGYYALEIRSLLAFFGSLALIIVCPVCLRS